VAGPSLMGSPLRRAAKSEAGAKWRCRFLLCP